MAFVHYRSRDPRPGHRGESLRTRRVADAWAQIRQFLAECTDDAAPQPGPGMQDGECRRLLRFGDDLHPGVTIQIADVVPASVTPSR